MIIELFETFHLQILLTDSMLFSGTDFDQNSIPRQLSLIIEIV